MKTVQMTLDEDLVKEVDTVVRKLHTTRSAFTRDALRRAIDAYRVAQLERRHRKGYEALPAAKDKAGVWEGEQDWGDA